ncbi:phospholipase D family protein [Rhizobium rhizogenes]|uniref:phospholipase D family protein n=1 Tax=Rhizobium rhizogenes TaxID=359 RepID=UPI0022C82077|nr:phospholipase D family protein [Rhizobium rhizogenes]MCZ7487174.1 phospholipase D family protein [Rhizobium rhizogenes]
MKLLTEIEAPNAISELLVGADSAKFAVAFWGNDASATLGISSRSKPLKIICNLESGACNPSEIRKLLKMTPNVEVRTNPRLHAKVYWTPSAVVIGSSNASANGLAVEGRELSSWAEANVLTTEHKMLEQTSTWFDALFAASNPIIDSDLNLAEELWRRRQFSRPMIMKTNVGLIETVRNNLDHQLWTSVKVTCWQDGLSASAASRLSAIVDDHHSGGEISAYEGWQMYLKEDDWTFDFFIEKDGSISFNDIWKIIPALPASPDLSLAVKREKFVLEGFGKIEFTDEDKRELLRAIPHFLAQRKLRKLPEQNERNAVFDLLAAVEYLNSVAKSGRSEALDTSSLEKEFHLAMVNVYDEAKNIGHTATAFKQMLVQHGGLETARRLVTGPVSETFKKFFLKGRVDLTVEALVLQERWKPLFSEDVLRAAQLRLRT